MTNHPNRSRQSRTVTLKIGDGGHLVACHPGTTSDLAIHVAGVPADVQLAQVAVQLSKVVLLPMGGPWSVAWERIADAPQGAVLRNCDLLG